MAGSSSAPIGRIRLEGGANLRRTLKAAEGKLEDLADLNRDVADVVARKSVKTAPVGPGPVHVKDTIRAAGTKTQAIVRAGNNKRGRNGVRYALAVHWGHQRPPDQDGRREVVRPDPWITTAAQDTQDQWVGLYRDRLQHIIDSVEGTTTP